MSSSFELVQVVLHPVALELYDAYMQKLPKRSKEIFEAVCASSCYNHVQIVKAIVAGLPAEVRALYGESLSGAKQSAIDENIILEVSQGYYRDKVDEFASCCGQGMLKLQEQNKIKDLAYLVEGFGKTNPLFGEVVTNDKFAISRLEDTYFPAQLIGILGAGLGSLFDAIKLTQSSSFLFPYQAAQISKAFPKELQLIYKLH